MQGSKEVELKRRFNSFPTPPIEINQCKDTKRRISQSYATFIVRDQGQDSEVYYNAI